MLFGGYELLVYDRCFHHLFQLFSEQLVPPSGCITAALLCKSSGTVSSMEQNDWAKPTKVTTGLAVIAK